jgi:cytochrome c-type biogenesis protein CcmH
MLFLLLFTALALCAVTAVCLPLFRGTPLVAERGYYDRVVYRDQLKEVDRDLARGVLSPVEADSARLEIQRRLLAVDVNGPDQNVRSQPSPSLAIVLGVLVLTGGAAIYLHFGSPSLPDAPFAGHAAQPADTTNGAPHLDMAQAAQRLEAKLQAEPNNADSWVLLARTESMLGNWPKASAAYSRALALGQKSADVYAGYGEMLVLAADGIIAPGAHEAFAHALAADPKNDVARYYLALADLQAGEDRRAIERWLSLAADIPEDSPMRDSIGRGVASAAKDAGIAVPELPKGMPAQPQPAEVQPGPNQQQMEGAAQQPPAQQKEMIRSMVAQLAARLKTQPNDLDGWLRLARSYGVLGETGKAVDAYEHAATLKPDDADIRLQEFHALIANVQPSEKLSPRAVEILHKVAAMAPEHPEVLWYLGVEAAQSGKPDAARADWTRLLSQLTPDGEDAKLVKTALDALPK